LVPYVPPHNVMTHTHRYRSAAKPDSDYSIANNFQNGYSAELSPQVFHVLTQADGKRPLAELMNAAGVAESEASIAEILDLWGQRFIRLRPDGTAE